MACAAEEPRPGAVAPVAADAAAPVAAPDDSVPAQEAAAAKEPAETPAANPTDAELDPPIDFAQDVQPIFAAHCLKCHNSMMAAGGLRLDSRAHALEGGYSGGTIVGGRLTDNELYRRVSSPDRTYRMPKNAEALSAAQLDTLRRWVLEGSPWPGADVERQPWTITGLVDWFAALGTRYEYEYLYLRPYALAFVIAQIGLLAVARLKGAYLRQRPWATGRLRRLGALAGRISTRELSLVWLLLLSGLMVAMLVAHQSSIARQLAAASAELAKSKDIWAKSVYGSPPAPIRPDHAKRLAGTYYRGNCERNPKLFNNGNYLTAVFRTHLCDAEGRQLGAGDPVPEGGLFVYIEIERAPGTTDELFSSHMMSSVFFSEVFYDQANPLPLKDKPTRLEALKEGWRWAARVPIGKPAEDNKLSGLIYLYTGKIIKGKVRGEPSYAISYDLDVEMGRLTDESDLWMGSFGNGSVADPLPAGKLPFTEWFDHRPIPVITGENSQDPKLLGVEEYVKKGLIDPAANKPAAAEGAAPAGDAPPKPADAPAPPNNAPQP
ncbi:MAG: c-type cytochrome domain-containing protein [Pirellulales bacterium]